LLLHEAQQQLRQRVGQQQQQFSLFHQLLQVGSSASFVKKIARTAILTFFGQKSEEDKG
jgi:hypothetical protein